ncbi:A disintegrin and metalloproteinase with thrombospondin motifs adt-2 isoform X2 [Formica exsecta]|uniref:A disintegrin and metalloproteinase with thrombospondin motifs adt-2 isoform X2 n=1 Tax=Formica exsecta TaxID=72781 RepID=UPI0011430708|nr:A disintegrin and metalloproteinase with thrombospondin motifs adt-2 isoform X2 [Formica exsecta]
MSMPSSVLRLVLVVLLNEAYARNTRDTEVILLPIWDSKGALEIPLTFKVFGQLIQLSLRRNDKIVSSDFQVWKHNARGVTEELSQLNAPDPCYYLHEDHIGSAAISFCQGHGLHGLVFLENVTLEITPLRNGIESSPLLVDDDRYIKEETDFLGKPHVVKRSSIRTRNLETPKRTRATRERLTLELAVFFDETAYRLFSPFLDGDDEKIRDMLLAYVNGIQALYHHPSLGVSIDISLIRLDVIQRQPLDLPHFGGERGGLLNSFCNYANARNPTEDTHPRHWDMGLYVTGLDLYALENGKRNGATMGLATVGGLCIPLYSCVIAELGVTDQLGKPYPSAGFTSVFIAAHEIGHNLGMHHDSSNNACPKDGYIMSPSRGVRGETVWSDCSREIAKTLSQTKPCLLDWPEPGNTSDAAAHDHYSRYRDLPGREWTAKRQCELLLRDKDANAVMLYESCQSLRCETPRRSGYYFAGPALDGTHCAPGRECRGGECMSVLEQPSDSERGSWSEWREDSCNSGCLQRSRGARIRRRFCENRNRRIEATSCKGPYYDVLLCNDEKLCRKKRRTIGEFATFKCALFSERLPELDGAAKGLQAEHEADRPWMACAIFCRRKDIAAYYAPRVELNDLGLDPYLPDGTWCHAEEGRDYFCRQHHCLPENFLFGKKSPIKDYRYEEELGPQNAGNQFGSTDRLVKYLTSGPDGLPLLTSVSRDITSSPDEDEWIDKDYIELPASEASFSIA